LKPVQNLAERVTVLNQHISLGDINSDDFVDWIRQGNKVDVTGDATYFTCLRILSESVGKLPIHSYRATDKGSFRDNNIEAIKVLRTRPNPHMTPSLFWSTVEANRLHNGNAYVYIRRNGAEVKDLWIMQTDDVDVLMDDAGIFGGKGDIWYRYSDPKTGEQYMFFYEQVLHLKTSFTFDGIVGVSIRDKLMPILEAGLSSQEFLTELYKGGLAAKAVLQYTSDLDKAARKRLVAGIKDFASGTKNAGGIIPIPLGMQLTPLHLKLTDAQFVELRKLNALQVAAAFGVKPNQLNDYERASYNNSEMQNLAFYTDTLLFIVKQYEEELQYKLLTPGQLENGYYFKFNVAAILRADQETQAKTLNSYVNNGVLRPNEARELLDYESDEYGNDLITNGNYIKLKDLGANYGISQEGGEGS